MSNELTIAPLASPEDGFQLLVELVRNAVPSPHTKRAYADALKEFRAWQLATGQTTFNKAAVNAYRTHIEERGLAPSTVAKALAAIRKLADELVDLQQLDAAGAEAIRRVKGTKRQGVRLGNWLSAGQAQELLNLPDTNTMKGKRDQALLAILLGAGLRRTEAADLTVGHLQQREGRWVIVDIIGKHGRVRSVPIAAWVKSAVDIWTDAAAITHGRLFRAINKGDNLTSESVSAQSLYMVIAGYAATLKVNLAPHDMRRTFAQLARKAHADIQQIQKSLGHASIQTTERYLGTSQDLTDAPSDRIKLRIETPRPYETNAAV